MKKLSLILAIILAILLLTSCSLEDPMDNPLCGGTVDNSNYNAPKEIKSKDLTSFEVEFFLYGKYNSDGDRRYWFSIKEDENGKLMLNEKWDDNANCEVDKSIFTPIQEIIDKYELVKLNGIDKHTAGLPDEYQPYFLKASYASGESLYFSENNNPSSKWAMELRDYFANVFHEHGIDDFIPPKTTGIIKRFQLCYTNDNMKYDFCELQEPYPGVEKSFEDLVTYGYEEGEYYVVIDSRSWNRKEDKEENEIQGEPSDEYYEGLQEIVYSSDIEDYDNGDGFPTDFDYENTANYFNFYIEYEYGNRLVGFSDDPEAHTKLLPTFEKIREYINNYIENNPPKVE